MLRLAAGAAVAEIVPGMGAGIASLSVEGRPALRPWNGREGDGPFALAMNLLAPFSNRINGGFTFEGTRHDLVPNLRGEPYPIHGDAFMRRWDVVFAKDDCARLRLPDGNCGPFRYAAEVDYTLSPARLSAVLTVTNTGDRTLPFGAGFHPWFPRTAETRLRFGAAGCWPETERHLRATAHPAALPPEWNWSETAPLPEGWINAGFDGWAGTADIWQGAGAASVRVASPDLGTLIVYSPSARADFFCLEPVSHPVDAHNLPGQPGLVPLSPGKPWAVSMTLDWQPA